jgi:hypothetical protein
MTRATGSLLAACTFAEYADVTVSRGWQRMSVPCGR